jgi:hypothetical protein
MRLNKFLKIHDHLAFDQKKGFLALITELLPHPRRLPPVAPGFSTPVSTEVTGNCSEEILNRVEAGLHFSRIS